MSAKTESKWSQILASASNARIDNARVAESLFIDRSARPAASLPASIATRKQVRNWMRRNADDNESLLAENAVAALNLPQSWLDDSTHWLWDEALAVAESIEA